MTEVKRNFYEVVYIVKQGASSSHVESLTSELSSFISAKDGEITKTEFCGLRYLAYPIKKSNKGHYVLLNIACSSECIKELEHKMNLNEDIIRFLVVKVEKLDNNPSALIRRANKESGREI